MNILVTGGAGFIGSHTCNELIKLKVDLIIIDNLENGHLEAVKRLEKINNVKINFYKIDLRDYDAVDNIFKLYDFYAVIHFAGLKAVGESNKIPLKYYDNNVLGTINLLNIMNKYNVKRLIFSSSATVYGTPKNLPITENNSLTTINPYGQTKLTIENILKDLHTSDNNWKIIILRYFNPVGAHPSGLLGEEPNGTPNNLFPYIVQVANKRREKLFVFGNNYPTKDGTGIRDYIHVVDLAKGHVAAIKKLDQLNKLEIYNLGTGKGYSVLEIINMFTEVCKKNIPYEITNRREGDVAECYADTSKAKKELDWKTEYDLKKICEDSWRWENNNPNRYK